MQPTVLIIDRDQGMTALLSGSLRSHGFLVASASAIDDGLLQIEAKSPQIVVVDLMTPEMDGRQTCQAIRSFSNVPIVVLSPLDQPAIVAGILDAGADDCLTKPVPSAVFIAHVTRLARRTGGLRSSVPGVPDASSLSNPVAS